MARDMRIPALAVLAAFAIGFSLGVICQGRAGDAGAAPGPTFDPRIHGGSVLQQAAADWLLIIRPDFDAVITEVEFVPRRDLYVNALTASPHAKDRCWKDDQGNTLTVPRCVGEALGKGRVRFAVDYQFPTIDVLLRLLAHEYAHHVLYANCGACAFGTDESEARADQCAADPTKCGRTP